MVRITPVLLAVSMTFEHLPCLPRSEGDSRYPLVGLPSEPQKRGTPSKRLAPPSLKAGSPPGLVASRRPSAPFARPLSRPRSTCDGRVTQISGVRGEVQWRRGGGSLRLPGLPWEQQHFVGCCLRNPFPQKKTKKSNTSGRNPPGNWVACKMPGGWSHGRQGEGGVASLRLSKEA